MRDGCPFCDYDDPGRIIEESLTSYVIRPLNPVTEGHVLVIPHEHVEHFTVRPDVTAAVMGHAARYARLTYGDCNLITSRGAAATQTVRHLHVHLVPRADGDGLRLPWSA